ncbi:MAG: peptidyl-tRNA hydrolase Pth2 [Candidatus Woesearchaeota archaeon]
MKQVILLRADLRLGVGKASAQVAHASLDAALKSSKDKLSEWRKEGMKKVVLKVKDDKELIQFQNLAKDKKLVASLITDAGLTEIPPGTITCLAIGPDEEGLIDSITGKLKMY